MPRRKNQATPEEQLLINERRIIIVEMLKTGMSYRELSDYLSKPRQVKVKDTRTGEDHVVTATAYDGKYACAIGTISSDFKAALKELGKLQALKVEMWRTLELARLDALYMAVYPRAIQTGDDKDVQTCLAISAERRRWNPQVETPLEANLNHKIQLELTYGDGGEAPGASDDDGDDSQSQSPTAAPAPETA
jgi:hypothetical protein